MFTKKLWMIRNSLRVQKFYSIKIINNNYSTTNNIHKSCKLLNSVNIKNSLNNQQTLVKLYSTEQLVTPKDPDVFGEIAGDKYQRLELTEEEEKEEEFIKNESRIPRRFKPSAGQYAQMIKNHLAKRDMSSAIGVLDLAKSNRDKPTLYMYTLLIRELAVQGNLKSAYKLFTRLKRDGLKPNGATYTSVLNACANCKRHKVSLEHLAKLRQEMITKEVYLNEAHYNAMIKAYGMHGKLIEAFQIVDIMVDNKVPIHESTFHSLIYAAISDKDCGLRHALIVWHMMRQRNIKPNLTTYNLMLRAIRDTKLGDLKINDLILGDNQQTRVLLTEGNYSDLLSSPPIISSYVLESVGCSPLAIAAKPEIEEKVAEESNDELLYVSKAPSHVAKKNTKNDVETEKNVAIETEKKMGNELIQKEDEKPMSKPPESSISLQSIHEKNRLILFGGYTGFMEHMEKDGIVPDVKNITLLMEVAPNSLIIEKELISLANKKGVKLDIDFFNMLIKKRSFRKDYKNAQYVLDLIQKHELTPNIMTWGVLALGCRTHEEGLELIQSMHIAGHQMNAVIAGALIGNAALRNDFNYIYTVMRIIVKNRIRPSKELYDILDKFRQKIVDIVTKKVVSKHSYNPRYTAQLEKLNRKYAELQEMFDRDIRTARIKNKNDNR